MEQNISYIDYSDLDDFQKEMVDSAAPYIRKQAAQCGYGLDRLMDDSSEAVRATVAAQGYRPDRLITDPYWGVREAIGNNGQMLEVLVNDPVGTVRGAIAYQNYGLDKLVDDPHYFVRRAVDEMLPSPELPQGDRLELWKQQYPERCALSISEQIDEAVSQCHFGQCSNQKDLHDSKDIFR